MPFIRLRKFSFSLNLLKSFIMKGCFCFLFFAMLWLVGSYFLTRDRTWGPCSKSAES